MMRNEGRVHPVSRGLSEQPSYTVAGVRSAHNNSKSETPNAHSCPITAITEPCLRVAHSL